jgi:hypothetical protein
VRLVDSVLGLPELDSRLALLDPNELVEVRMRLTANVLPRPQAHDGELGVLAGEQHGAERPVLERRPLDIAYPTHHLGSSLLSLPCATSFSVYI